MARDEFDNAGSYVQIKDLEGELVLFTPTSYVEEVSTSFGTKDAIVTDLVVLSQEGQPEYYDVMLFQGVLIGTLKSRISVERTLDRDPVSGVVTTWETTTSRRVLGVVTKGDAKKGQNAPYLLGPATDAQEEIARKYCDENPTPAPVRRMLKQEVKLSSAPAVLAKDMHDRPTRSAELDNPASEPVTSSDVPMDFPSPEDPFAV